MEGYSRDGKICLNDEGRERFRAGDILVSSELFEEAMCAEKDETIASAKLRIKPYASGAVVDLQNGTNAQVDVYMGNRLIKGEGSDANLPRLNSSAVRDVLGEDAKILQINGSLEDHILVLMEDEALMGEIENSPYDRDLWKRIGDLYTKSPNEALFLLGQLAVRNQAKEKQERVVAAIVDQCMESLGYPPYLESKGCSFVRDLYYSVEEFGVSGMAKFDDPDLQKSFLNLRKFWYERVTGRVYKELEIKLAEEISKCGALSGLKAGEDFYLTFYPQNKHAIKVTLLSHDICDNLSRSFEIDT